MRKIRRCILGERVYAYSTKGTTNRGGEGQKNLRIYHRGIFAEEPIIFRLDSLLVGLVLVFCLCSPVIVSIDHPTLPPRTFKCFENRTMSSAKVSLLTGGKRSAVEEEEATKILLRFQKRAEGRVVNKVDLSCRAWKKTSLLVIKPFLEQIAKDVSIVNLADVIAGLMTDEGLSVTETLAEVFKESNLVDIDLSDNAMGPRGLLRVESLFLKSNLERLYLSNCGLSAESMDMLKSFVLADDGRIAKSLKELVLDKNMIGVNGAKVVGEFLPKCTKLEYLSYNGCRPIAEGTKHLCDGILGLASNCEPSLVRLDMEDCTFGGDEDHAIAPFSKALKKCRQLQYLNMKDGDLGCEGLQLLTDALTESTAKLTHLYLGKLVFCVVMKNSCVFLLIKRRPLIRNRFADGCGEWGSEGARILADYLQSRGTTIKCLHVNFNEIGDEGVAILLEPFCAIKNVLEELSLVQNEIEGVGSDALVSANLPKLRVLNLEDNDDVMKGAIKARFGAKVLFGQDDDDDEELDDAVDDDMDEIIKALSAAAI